MGHHRRSHILKVYVYTYYTLTADSCMYYCID